MNNLRFREFYRRHLPHIQIPGATYFVTFRLKNSLPLEILEKLKTESEQIQMLPPAERDLAHRRWFGKFDTYLDQCLNEEKHLQNQQIAEIVMDSFHRRNGKVYDLLAFCIMPNHAHAVFTPLEKTDGQYYSLTEILHSLKRNSAKQANLLLGKTGPFWQDESYDHFIRDEGELDRVSRYTLNNPVKAGLVQNWADWPGTYSKHNYR